MENYGGRKKKISGNGNECPKKIMQGMNNRKNKKLKSQGWR